MMTAHGKLNLLIIPDCKGTYESHWGFTYFPPIGNGPIAEAYVEAGIGGDATLAESMPD
ncbi:MAG: hypothetical protein Ct9H90mP25_5620 [Gammaproteobacteria bacterium]|nr:MAG: hypothetical protein Ct9H90mP25_5620 [Gammaproteobacteria bacterium]